MKKIIFETLILVVLSLVFGTGFHILRTDKKSKIAFFDADKSPRAFVVASGGEVSGEADGNVVNLAPVDPPNTSANPSTDPPTVSPLSPPGNDPQKEPTQKEEVVDGGPVREILLKEAYEEWGNETTFIDARRTRHYEEGHIKGARTMSVWEGDFDDNFTNFMNDIEDTETPFVLYCMSKNCEDSHMLADRMVGAGFTNLMVFKEGYPGWSKAGYPTEKGPEKPSHGEEEE